MEIIGTIKLGLQFRIGITPFPKCISLCGFTSLLYREYITAISTTYSELRTFQSKKLVAAVELILDITYSVVVSLYLYSRRYLFKLLRLKYKFQTINLTEIEMTVRAPQANTKYLFFLAEYL